WMPVQQQPFTDEESRHAVAEADLDRPRRFFARHPVAQRLALIGADSNGEEAVNASVRTGDRCFVPDQAVNDSVDPSGSRPFSVSRHDDTISSRLSPAMDRTTGWPLEEPVEGVIDHRVGLGRRG